MFFQGEKRRRVQKKFPENEAIRTEQHHKEDCDVNNIVRRHLKTGQLPWFAKQGNPQFGDFSEVGSYHEAMNTLLDARDQFETLPAQLRKRFGNDPGEFLEFVHNPENAEEMVKLGLATKKQDNASEEPPSAKIEATPSAKPNKKNPPAAVPPEGKPE